MTRIVIADYDERWPERYRLEAARIRAALGPRALRIEHTGSTSVPGLPAKPVIDILLIVTDTTAEHTYAPDLESAGYELLIREPDWYQHRLFKTVDKSVNLHVLPDSCPEIDRILLFRDWLRANSADRELYANTKRALAQQTWPSVDDYADAKTEVIRDILDRAGRKEVT